MKLLWTDFHCQHFQRTHTKQQQNTLFFCSRETLRKNRFDFVRFRQNTGTIWHTADHIYLWQIKIGMNLCVKCKRTSIFVPLLSFLYSFLAFIVTVKSVLAFPFPLNVHWIFGQFEMNEEKKTKHKIKTKVTHRTKSNRIESNRLELTWNSLQSFNMKRLETT